MTSRSATTIRGTCRYGDLVLKAREPRLDTAYRVDLRLCRPRVPLARVFVRNFFSLLEVRHYRAELRTHRAIPTIPLADAPMSVKAPKRKKVGRPELSGSGRPRGPRTASGTAGSPSCSCPRQCA